MIGARPLVAGLVLGAACCLAPPDAAAAPLKWTARVTSQGVFHVEGSADLPDDAFLYVRASFAEGVFARAKAVVRDGRFRAQLGPFDRELWAGEYLLTVRLMPGRQLPEVRRGAPELTPYRSEQSVRYGSERLEAEQEEVLRSHYGGCLTTAREQLAELLDRFCSCARTLPGFSGPEGVEPWRNWLIVWHLLSPDPEIAGRQLQRWKDPTHFVSEEGQFLPERWRAWLEELQAGLAKALRAHRRFLARHVAPKHPRSAQDVELLFKILGNLSAHYSAALHKGQSLEIDPRDVRGDVKLPSRPRGADIDHFRQLARAIYEDVRLGG